MSKDYRKAKPNWYRESLNPMGPRAQQDKENYKIKSPWETTSNELMDDFDQQLNALDVNVTHLWDEGSYELRIKEKEREAAKNYKFHSLFEVPELSDKKKQQLATYEYNPPFNCGFNAVDVAEKSAKKLNPNMKNPKTRAPWTYGELPADPPAFKIHEKPKTALWDVPKGDQSADKPLESSGDPVLDQLREQLKSHGALGISGLSRKFRIMDDDGSGTLNYEEFRKGMRETGLTTLSEKALRHLFLYFDRDDSGAISYDEFLVGVRGVMNERRRGLVAMAFKVLDKDGSGQIDMEDIRGVYNARFHPDVIAEKRTEEEVLIDFLHSFERPINPNSKTKDPTKRDGTVTLEEFIEYYQNISASVDNDDYFELMIRNAWHISGGTGWSENTTNKRVLVTDIHGNQTVQELKDDIRIKKDDAEAMLANLKQQGIDNVAYLNTSDKLTMKHTIQNPNIVEIRTKYGAASGGPSEDHHPASMPLNAYFNASMTHGLPPTLSGSTRPRTMGASRPAPPPALNTTSAPSKLQLDTTAINRPPQQQIPPSRGGGNGGRAQPVTVAESSPMPLNAYARGGGGIGNQTIPRPGVMGGSQGNSRSSSARSNHSGLNRTLIY